MSKAPATKATSTTGNPRAKSYTYWCTRECDPTTGALSNRVKIWLAPPIRFSVGIGSFWAPPAFDADYYGDWSLEQAQKHVHVYPDDDRQCIRVEGDRVRQAGDAVLGMES